MVAVHFDPFHDTARRDNAPSGPVRPQHGIALPGYVDASVADPRISERLPIQSVQNQAGVMGYLGAVVVPRVIEGGNIPSTYDPHRPPHRRLVIDPHISGESGEVEAY